MAKIAQPPEPPIFRDDIRLIAIRQALFAGAKNMRDGIGAKPVADGPTYDESLQAWAEWLEAVAAI